MSLAHVTNRDPKVAKAIKQGWTWTVLHRNLRSIYGDRLFELMSESKNTTLHRKQGEVEVMLNMYKKAKQQQD